MFELDIQYDATATEQNFLADHETKREAWDSVEF